MNLEKFIKIVKPYTMTSIERITELYNSLEYVRLNNIHGDIVECGVWEGGNILGILEYLNFHKIYEKNVWLYDTFNGMTEPDENDIDLHNNKATDTLKYSMCISSLEKVKSTLSKSSFSQENIKYIVGDVLDTLDNEKNIPQKISLLRLDTDWYKSTKKELDKLYPVLVQGGVLIVDDYGHWQGAKKAVDEFFQGTNIDVSKIDYTGIKIIKL